jgi:hypothetical protein
MLKRILVIAALAAGISCSAGSAVKVDITNVLGGNIVINPGKASKGLTVVTYNTEGNPKCALTFHSDMNISKNWTKYSFSFTPDKDGSVNIHFRGALHKLKGAKKNVAVWVAYDNITVTGTEAKNCDFEFVNQNNMFDGWEGSTASMVTGSEDAKSGKNYVIVWHDDPVYQVLKVKKGQEVTVTFYAKASDGQLKKKSDLDNI